MKCFAFALLLLSSYITSGQITDFGSTDFSKADSIATQYTAHSLVDLKTLALRLTDPLPTEQEKFRAIYKWVCSNIEADYEMVQLNKTNRATLKGDQLDAWNKQFNKVVFKTLLQEQKTVCTGFAYLIRALSHHAGLQCEIINGYARHAGIQINSPMEINHSWNEIRLNDKWYVCDATWSSGVFNINSGTFVKKYNDVFFLTAPSLFSKTHHALDKEYHVSLSR